MSALYRVLAQLLECKAAGVKEKIDVLHDLGRLTDDEYNTLITTQREIN